MALIDLSQGSFAYSFSHAVVAVNDRQFSAVSGVSISQDLSESAVYGTDARPIGRSVGQLSLGRGQLTFSEMGDAVDFFSSLGDEPFMALWALDYSLANGAAFRQIECRACRLTGLGIDHSAGADALAMTYPFSFLQCRIDGRDLVLSPKGILQAGLGIAQRVVNLL